jgi:hypothetical protein
MERDTHPCIGRQPTQPQNRTLWDSTELQNRLRNRMLRDPTTREGIPAAPFPFKRAPAVRAGRTGNPQLHTLHSARPPVVGWGVGEQAWARPAMPAQRAPKKGGARGRVYEAAGHSVWTGKHGDGDGALRYTATLQVASRHSQPVTCNPCHGVSLHGTPRTHPIRHHATSTSHHHHMVWMHFT